MVLKYLKVVFYSALIASLAYYLAIPFTHTIVDKIFITFICIFLADLVQSIINRRILTRVKSDKNQYALKRLIAYFSYLIALIVVLSLWVTNTQTLTIAMGAIGVGMIVVLQDPISSILAFSYILISRPFSVGDRIEINGISGDVIDIDLFTIKLMETGQWVKADQVTGRIISVPNNTVFKSPIFNYTKDFSFIWDEIAIPVTHNSDWKKAVDIMLSVANENNKGAANIAAEEFQRMSKKYLVKKKDLLPSVYVTFNDNWIELNLRYIASAIERRTTRDKLDRAILEGLAKEKSIHIASETVDVTLRK